MAVPILTGPEPIGIGTAGCESLSSYVQRLALARGVAPVQILYRVLTWCEAGALEGVGHWRERPRRLRTGNFNGFKHADAWVRALQRATLRADLHHLTTRAWDENFPPRGFLSPTQKWCPPCLAADAVPYHRVVWSLQPCHCCPTHGVSLVNRCPNCSKPVPTFHERSVPTFCPGCGADLRLAEPQPVSSAFDLWCARELGSLVAASAQLNLKLTWNPPQALGRLAREAKCPDAAAIGRRLNTSKVTIWYWLRGRARPNLASSLGYHYAFGASLAKTLGASAPPELHAAQPEMHLSGRKKSVRRDWGDVKRVLEAELASPACRSLRQLSGVLQTPVRTLRAHFPDLCRRIADARRAQQRGALDQSDTLLVTKLTRAKNELECALTAPTPANLEKHLSVPGLLNRRGPRRALRALGHA